MITLKWTKREIAYQFVHMFLGFWVALITFAITGSLHSIVAGSIVGLIVEIVQYYTTDQRRLFLPDRFRDWWFWSIGSYSLIPVLYCISFGL